MDKNYHLHTIVDITDYFCETSLIIHSKLIIPHFEHEDQILGLR